MNDLLTDVIAIGGRALEAEDVKLRAIYKSRGQHGGLLRTDFERYYQFVVWRSLVEKYDAQIEFSCEGFPVDLTVNSNGQHIFEMKNWREEHTTRLSSDIRRLQNFHTGGYLLVFSNNPPDLTVENLDLIGQLPGISSNPAIHRFMAEYLTGKPFEFWFAGWQVGASSSA